MDSLESIFSMQYVLTVTLSSCEKFCCTRFFFSYSIRTYVSFVPICHLMQCDNCRGFRLNCLFRFKIWWMIPIMERQAAMFQWKLNFFSLKQEMSLASMMKILRQHLRTPSTFCFYLCWMDYFGQLCKEQVWMSLSFVLKAVGLDL